MEDFLTFWETFYSSPAFWNLDVFDKSILAGRISESKLDLLDCVDIQAQLSNIKQGVKSLEISEEVMDLMHKEYMSNHNNIIDVLNKINDHIEKGLAF